MNATIRFLRCVAPSAVLSLALGLGSWQVASAQAPPAGPGGPTVAPVGPAVAAPVGPAIAGPGIVAGDVIDVPPPGPALVHHFAHIVRYPRRYHGEMIEYRTELLLFADNTFHMIYPAMDWGYGAANQGPEKIIGTWGLVDDRLDITFDDGFIDYGLLTIGKTGPLLRFAGRRWTDLLAVAAPVAPAGPVGPAVAAPVGPAVAAPVGPAIAAPIGPAPQ